MDKNGHFLFWPFLAIFLCTCCSLLSNYPWNEILILKSCSQPEIFILKSILEFSMMAIAAIWAEMAGIWLRPCAAMWIITNIDTRTMQRTNNCTSTYFGFFQHFLSLSKRLRVLSHGAILVDMESIQYC